MKLFISTINYNGRKNTIDFLDSLMKTKRSGIDLNVLVVDNASDETFEVNEGDYSDLKLRVIKSEVNLGFSGGHNLGVKEALGDGADYVLIMNNDVLVDEDFIIELIKPFDDSEIGIVSPKIYFEKNHEFHKDKYKEDEKGKVIWYAGGKMDWKNVLASHVGVDEVDKGQFGKGVETDFATGCAMMVRRDVFDKIGNFDERYFLYFEDNDLCQRARKNGFKIYFEPRSVIWHKNADSTGGSGSILQDYYISRNRLLFASKYAPNRSKIAVLKEGLLLLKSGRKWQKKGVLDFYSQRFGKGNIN